MFAKLRFLFFKYYYLIFILIGLSQMLRVQGGWTAFCYFTFLLTLTLLRDIKYQTCDILVLFFIGYSLITYPLFGDYPAGMYTATIRDQIFPISLYFVARSQKTKNIDILQTAIYPFMAAYIIGIFLFVTSPGWYIDYRMGDRGYTNDITRYFNLTRMSSFWSSSYCVGYSSLFIIIYIFDKYFFNKQKIKYFGIVLIISFLSLFFAQQRISIGFAAFYFLIIAFVSVKSGKIAPRKFFSFALVATVFVGILAIVTTKYLDKYYFDFVLERFTNNNNGIVEDRVNMFKDYVSSITLFGSGLGRYSHNAEFHNLDYISDCEYIRTPNEIGIFGMSIFVFIVLISFISNYNRGRKFSFESLIVLFFLLAMVGATPLEVSQQQPFVLWYCLGKMQNKYDRRKHCDRLHEQSKEPVSMSKQYKAVHS